jgi:hypothetical protein
MILKNWDWNCKNLEMQASSISLFWTTLIFPKDIIWAMYAHKNAVNNVSWINYWMTQFNRLM